MIPTSLLKLAKLIARAKEGLSIDEVWMDDVKATQVSGHFKLEDEDTLRMKCDYTAKSGKAHSLTAVNRDGPSNNELNLDGNDLKLVSMKLKPDFDTTVKGVTVELEAILKYKDAAGDTHSIKLSSSQIGLL